MEYTRKFFSSDLAYSGTARGWRTLRDGFDSRLGPNAFDMCTPGAAYCSASSLRSSLQKKREKMRKRNQIKVKSSLYSRYYAEACNEWRGPCPRLSARATQLRRNVAMVASRWRHRADLTGPGMRKRVNHNFFVMKASCTCPITVMPTCWGSTSEVMAIDSLRKAKTLKQCRIAVNCTKSKTGKLCFKCNKTVCDKCAATEFYIMRHGLAVPRAGDKFYATGSIYGWRTSRLTYLYRVVADWKSISSPRSHSKLLLNFWFTIF